MKITKSRMREIIKEEYNELQLMRLPSSYYKNPDEVIADSEKELHKIEKKLKPLLRDYLNEEGFILEAMKQQIDMGDNTNKKYLKPQTEWVKQLDDVKFKLEKGKW